MTDDPREILKAAGIEVPIEADEWERRVGIGSTRDMGDAAILALARIIIEQQQQLRAMAASKLVYIGGGGGGGRMESAAPDARAVALLRRTSKKDLKAMLFMAMDDQESMDWQIGGAPDEYVAELLERLKDGKS
jgi:hypothetical protein